MADQELPFFAKNIYNPQPWEQPFQGSPAEVYNAFRNGQKDIPAEGRNQALGSTQYHFSPAFRGVWDPKWNNMFPMPHWGPDKYEEFNSKSPMSNLGTISSILKSG